MKKKSVLSYLMLVSAMLIFGTIGIFRRFIPLSSGSLAFTRGVIGALFLLALSIIFFGVGIMKLKKKNKSN